MSIIVVKKRQLPESITDHLALLLLHELGGRAYWPDIVKHLEATFRIPKESRAINDVRQEYNALRTAKWVDCTDDHKAKFGKKGIYLWIKEDVKEFVPAYVNDKFPNAIKA